MPSASHPETDSEVDIVVLNWNGWRDTLLCVGSLEELDYPDRRVIVVDNGSDDGSPHRIRESCPGVVVLETGANLGFAGGNNVAIRSSLERGARFVWLLNNDTVVSPGTLTSMMAEMRGSEAVGIVGSVIRSMGEPDSVEAWGGGTVDPRLGTTRRLTGRGPGDLDYVSGTSMLVRREVFEDVGLLDEDFFFYLEDVDFCCRARARGWKLAVAHEAAVFHAGGASVNEGRGERSLRGDRYHARSSGVFIGKHGGLRCLPWAALRLCGMVVRRVLRDQVRRVPGVSAEFVRGLATGIRRHG